MANSEQIFEDLLAIYEPLLGKTFPAKYRGEYDMPLKGTMRDVLVIEPGTPFAATLHQISKAVHSTIWKGMTGPEDGFAEYWLWVEPIISNEELQEYTDYNFKVEKCTPFKGSGGEFSYGISIKVTVID